MPSLLLFPSAPFLCLHTTATIVAFFPLLSYIQFGSSVGNSPLFSGFFRWQFFRDLPSNCHAMCVEEAILILKSRYLCMMAGLALCIINNVTKGGGFACLVFSDLGFAWWARNCCGDFVASFSVTHLVGGFNVVYLCHVQGICYLLLG